MDWAAVWTDIAGGLVIAGAIGAWVPDTFWRTFFLVSHPTAALIWGPLVGPLISVVSFVCSVGNVPLAAVLWNGGISFGGVVAFIFADLIIIPILNIYRKYYGGRTALYLFATSYLAMATAGFAVELLFNAMGIIPAARHAIVPEAHIALNYTTVLNVIALGIGGALLVHFVTTGGRAMLRTMNQPIETPPPASPHAHAHHEHADPRERPTRPSPPDTR